MIRTLWGKHYLNTFFGKKNKTKKFKKYQALDEEIRPNMITLFKDPTVIILRKDGDNNRKKCKCC